MFLGVLGLGAAWCSPVAADDGAPLPSVPAVTDVAAHLLEDAGVAEALPVLEVEADPLSTLPAASAQLAAAEPATEGAVAAPPPEPALQAPAEAVVEQDPPAEAVAEPTPDAPPAEPLVEQTAPTNVNVSIRVDSAGDNGPVAQVNIASGIAAASDPTRYQPEAPQYQAPIPDDPVPAAQSTADPTVSPSASDESEGSWTWTWNCGTPVPEIPLGVAVAGMNWNWNWDWNCDDDEQPAGNSESQSAPQYQPVVTQYRPININISIRINSPGNDGPVLQTNVAVAVIPPVLQIPVLHVPPQPRPTGDTPQPAANQGDSTAATAPASPMQTVLTWFDGGFELDAMLVDLDGCCLVRQPRGVPYAEVSTRNVLLPPRLPANRRDITAPQRFRTAVAVTMRLTRAAERTARAQRTAAKPIATVRPAPSRRPSWPTHEPALRRGAAGFAPLNAPDGRLGYLVALVLGLAFAIAFADASRSVAAEVRRAGEDPDRPPDRPG